MVKLQVNQGKYFLCVPREKALRKRWQGGEEFDTEFDANGNLVFVEIKKESIYQDAKNP